MPGKNHNTILKHQKILVSFLQNFGIPYISSKSWDFLRKNPTQTRFLFDGSLNGLSSETELRLGHPGEWQEFSEDWLEKSVYLVISYQVVGIVYK